MNTTEQPPPRPSLLVHKPLPTSPKPLPASPRTITAVTAIGAMSRNYLSKWWLSNRCMHAVAMCRMMGKGAGVPNKLLDVEAVKHWWLSPMRFDLMSWKLPLEQAATAHSRARARLRPWTRRCSYSPWKHASLNWAIEIIASLRWHVRDLQNPKVVVMELKNKLSRSFPPIWEIRWYEARYLI